MWWWNFSLSTEKEDLGTSKRNRQKPPIKWEVYEQILRVPYYIVYERYTNRLQAFSLSGGHYQALEVVNARIWLSELKLGLVWNQTESSTICALTLTPITLKWATEIGNLNLLGPALPGLMNKTPLLSCTAG